MIFFDYYDNYKDENNMLCQDLSDDNVHIRQNTVILEKFCDIVSNLLCKKNEWSQLHCRFMETRCPRMQLNKLLCAYKYRLTRFGFELIEDLIKEHSKGEIIILNKKDDMEPDAIFKANCIRIQKYWKYFYIRKMN